MMTAINDYNGHCYTVVPCYVSDSSRIHYCGAYAKDFKTWRVIDELVPKEITSVAKIDEEAQKKEDMQS